MIEVSKEAYINEVKAMFNHICLVGDTQLERCIGFSEDALDFYYICKDLRGKVAHHTFVGPCVSLKNIYPRYDILENLFTLNGSPPENEFEHKIFPDIDNWKTYKIKTVNGEIDDEWMKKYYELRNNLEEYMGELFMEENYG